MTPVLASVGRSALRPYLRDVSDAPPLPAHGGTYKVFIIFAPISINFTVSTNAELTYVGWGFSWTSRSVTVSGVQIMASSCSSMVGIGVLRNVSAGIHLDLDNIRVFGNVDGTSNIWRPYTFLDDCRPERDVALRGN